MDVTVEIREDIYNYCIEYKKYEDCLKYRDVRRIIQCIAERFADLFTDYWVQSKRDWFRRVTPDEAWIHFRNSQGRIIEEMFMKVLIEKLCTLYENNFVDWKGREAVKKYEELFPEGCMVSFDYFSITIKFRHEVIKTRPKILRRHEILIFRDLFKRRGYVCPELPVEPELLKERFEYTLDLLRTIEKWFPEYIYNIDFLAFQQWKEVREFYQEMIRRDAVLRFLQEANMLRRIEKPVRYIGLLVDRAKHLLMSIGNRFDFARKYIQHLIASYGYRWFAGMVTRSLIFIDIDGKTLETFEEIGKLLVMLVSVYGCRNFIIVETYRGFHIIGFINLHKRDWLMLYRDLVLRNCNFPKELIEHVLKSEGIEYLPECTWRYVDFWHAWYSFRRGKSILRISTTRTRWLRICMVIKDLKIVEDRTVCPVELRMIVRRVLERFR